MRILRERAARILAITGLGVVRSDGPSTVIFTYVDGLGATAYRVDTDDLAPAFRPGLPDLRRIDAASLDAEPLGFVQSRLLNTGLPEHVRTECAIAQVFVLPVPDAEHPTTLIVATGSDEALSAGQRVALESIAADVVGFLDARTTADEELALLRRLAEVETLLLPTLFRVLDVREIFNRLSALTKGVLPHDFASLGVLSDDLEHVELYAQTGDGALYAQGGRMPFAPVQTRRLLYRLVDDLRDSPLERNLDGAGIGGRSSIRVAVRLDEQVLGSLNFTSKELKPYDAADLVIAERIAAYVALALSHHRLAEDAQRTEALRARAENLERLDRMLGSLGASGELAEVFERLASIARIVLPHDGLVVPVILPDGAHARLYTVSGIPEGELPDVIEVPESLLQDPLWEHEIIDDVRTRREATHIRTAAMGFRSTLRVPIRLDGRFAGSLIFASRTPAAFGPADVPVAARMADRVALTLSRDRTQQATERANAVSARARELESRVRDLTEELDARTGFRRVLGSSPAWHAVLTQATKVASTDTTVLLLGESGTGKEVVARFLHRASNRASGPFVGINCAALPEQLLESELFGHERGAFTGASQSTTGRLEQAAGGTFFLDEVAEMSMSAQAKFLRVLQEREFQRVGGSRVLRTDARIVAATNRDLPQTIEQGRFREDLYYRLNVFAIILPPLRDRPDDIIPMSEALLAEIGRGMGRPPAGISRDARKLLMEYPWPGNVRELRNILERATILCEGGLVTPEHLALRIPEPTTATSSSTLERAHLVRPTTDGDLQSIERDMIHQALEDARFNKSKAARALGLTRQQLYLRLRKHGLE